MSELIFVTGGARSGKSRFALARATEIGGEDVTFIATAQALDAEMRERIATHRFERNPRWQTVEEPVNLSAALEGAIHEVVVLDCLSLWVSNLMLAGLKEAAILEEATQVFSSQGKRLIVVSNEVGFGIVPDNALARTYRDVLGRVNQTFAAVASEAHLLVSGLPLRLK